MNQDNWSITQEPNCESLTSNSVADVVLDYDVSKTATVVVEASEAFTNSKAVKCPITRCYVS